MVIFHCYVSSPEGTSRWVEWVVSMCSFHFPKPSIAILDHHLGNGGVHRALIQGKHLNQLVQMEGIVDGGIREQVGSWVTQRPTGWPVKPAGKEGLWKATREIMRAIWICLMVPRYRQIWWLIIILSHEKCNKLASKPSPDKLRKASTFIFSVIMAFTYKRGHRGSFEGKNCDLVLWMGNVRPRDSHSCAVLVNLVNLVNRLFWACL